MSQKEKDRNMSSRNRLFGHVSDLKKITPKNAGLLVLTRAVSDTYYNASAEVCGTGRSPAACSDPSTFAPLARGLQGAPPSP